MGFEHLGSLRITRIKVNSQKEFSAPYRETNVAYVVV